MNDTIQTRMLGAVYACLLPLARMLLRSGITYRQFDAIVKSAFVREAMTEGDLRGRPTNTSRVAVKTGLSRKDVKRIRELLLAERSAPSGTLGDQAGPPARVLHTWHADARFSGLNGVPNDLEFQEGNVSFCVLVRAVAGDVPPGAVRAELKKAGAIIELEDGKLRAVKRYYVPGSVDEKAIITVSGMLFPLTAGLAHNADPTRTTDGFIQRLAFSENLDDQSAMEFRHWSRAEATRFIEHMDDWIARHEPSGSPVPPAGPSKRTVGIGVFYYEGPSADEVVKGTELPLSQ